MAWNNNQGDNYFDQHYTLVVQTLLEDDELKQDIGFALKRLGDVIDYNVPHGKKLRGKLVPMLYNALAPSATDAEKDLANKIGWVLQIHQSAVQIADDIMDKSETRHEKLCWYRATKLGVAAFNDTLILEHATFHLLKQILSENSALCIKMIDLFLDVSFKTCLGQGMDLETGVDWNNFNNCTMDLCKVLVKYKAAFYCFYLPTACSLLLAGVYKEENQDLWNIIEKITLDMGFVYQVQDDFMDCFGDDKKTGKLGTDTENGKCTWLFVKAKEICEGTSDTEWENLKAHYGRNDEKSVSYVQNTYKKFEMQRLYNEFQKESFAQLKEHMEKIPEKFTGFKQMLQALAEKLFNRSF